MKKQETMPDAQYRKSVREIIKRDFFPELSNDKIDETVDKFGSLNSFCASCVSAEDADFVKQVEHDRQLLKSSAPVDKRSEIIRDQNPWKSSARDPLFFEPVPLMIETKTDKRPAISYEQTRFSSARRHALSVSSESTTTTESESEFEGRSQFRKEFMQISRERLERRKRMSELSAKGRALLKSLGQI